MGLLAVARGSKTSWVGQRRNLRKKRKKEKGSFFCLVQGARGETVMRARNAYILFFLKKIQNKTKRRFVLGNYFVPELEPEVGTKKNVFLISAGTVITCTHVNYANPAGQGVSYHRPSGAREITWGVSCNECSFLSSA